MTKTAKSTRLYAIKSTYNPETRKTSSKVVENLGSAEDIMRREGISYDAAIAWARNYIAKLTEQAAVEGSPLQIRLRPGRRIRKNTRRLKNIGYAFAVRAFEESGLSKACVNSNCGDANAGACEAKDAALATSSRLLFGTFNPQDADVELLGAESQDFSRAEQVVQCLGESACDSLAFALQDELSQRVGGAFPPDELVATMRDMDMLEIAGEGWVPAYTRTRVTDALHDSFGFRTDFEILTNRQLRKIIA